MFWAHFLLLDADFWLSLSFTLYLFPQIFSDFIPNVGSRNIDNKSKRHKELDMGGSHGCVATQPAKVLTSCFLTFQHNGPWPTRQSCLVDPFFHVDLYGPNICLRPNLWKRV